MSAKGLKTLIRLEKLKLDNERRQLAILETQRDKMYKQGDDFEREYAAEQKVAAESIDNRLTFEAYQKRHHQRMSDLQQAIITKQAEIEEKAELVQIAFQELKKLEIAQANRIAAEEKERALKEQNEADEKATQKYIRKSNPDV